MIQILIVLIILLNDLSGTVSEIPETLTANSKFFPSQKNDNVKGLRMGRLLTSVQKKFWWPFNSNKEIVISKSLSKYNNNYNDRYSSCESCYCNPAYCLYDGYHLNFQQSQYPPINPFLQYTRPSYDPGTSFGQFGISGGGGINFMHHIHHNQQQQQFYPDLGQIGQNLGFGSVINSPFPYGNYYGLGGGFGNQERLRINDNIATASAVAQAIPQHSATTNTDTLANDKLQVALIQEKIRLQEELKRIKKRGQGGVRQVHHYHGPTYQHGQTIPEWGDESSAEDEDLEEIDKKLEIAKAEKNAAKAHLLASLIKVGGGGSGFGNGQNVLGLGADIINHGISRIPNQAMAGFLNPGGQSGFVSVGPSAPNPFPFRPQPVTMQPMVSINMTTDKMTPGTGNGTMTMNTTLPTMTTPQAPIITIPSIPSTFPIISTTPTTPSPQSSTEMNQVLMMMMPTQAPGMSPMMMFMMPMPDSSSMNSTFPQLLKAIMSKSIMSNQSPTSTSTSSSIAEETSEVSISTVSHF